MTRTAFFASPNAYPLSISSSLVVKMSQKPSLPQSLQTVQLVLTGNSNFWHNYSNHLRLP